MTPEEYDRHYLPSKRIRVLFERAIELHKTWADEVRRTSEEHEEFYRMQTEHLYKQADYLEQMSTEMIEQAILNAKHAMGERECE